MAITRDQAIGVARHAVEAVGGKLEEPLIAVLKTRWFFWRGSYWYVVSSVDRKGGNWFVTVDEATGEILSKCQTRK
jgi:hypothetical protein